MNKPTDMWMYYDHNRGRMIALGSRKQVEAMVREDLERYEELMASNDLAKLFKKKFK